MLGCLNHVASLRIFIKHFGGIVIVIEVNCMYLYCGLFWYLIHDDILDSGRIDLLTNI